MVTPFAPSARWIRAYVSALSEGSPHDDACLAAGKASGLRGKDFARTPIAGGTLTVPVEGGSHALKSRGADPAVSEHGKWRREHAGAWLAAYGRTPFFAHLMPEMEEAYALSPGMRLEDFNRLMLRVAMRWIDLSVLGDGRFGSKHSEIRNVINYDLSIFDAIFRLGKETSFIF